ncbi:MFS transporter [Arenibaculum pallidiluteum]|uniref:MFS transporter n=1 Tax=Arenibaculum pallidiluteum TaxID=2812559 RepID=UPI001A95C83E|nr:MFS transporter [Arenibaculum pallidiluteum]
MLPGPPHRTPPDAPLDATLHAPPASTRIAVGTAEYRRTMAAVFSVGFSTFALLYCVQPLLPVLADEFAVSPAASSLTLSAATAVLAFAMLVSSSISEAFGRKRVMAAALVASGLTTLATAAVDDFAHLVALRALLGLALSGLPAVAVAYLTDEIEARSIGGAIGLYIAGTTVGGMGGRLITAAVTDLASWRVAVATLGCLGLGAAVILWRSLPASRHFQPSRGGTAGLARMLGAHLRDPGLRLLFVSAFLLMGGFVTVYNYVGFRLLEPPYGLSQTLVGLVFLVYLAGTISSAWMGGLADRMGRRRVLWSAILLMLAGLGITLLQPLALVILGVAVFTFGFFGAHSVASSWVGLRARAGRAQASALYLLSYYMGSSIAGSVGGLFWTAAGWPGVVLLVGGLSAAGLVVAALLTRVPPVAPQQG